MGENSSIQWTDHTFNPWIGCQKISPACKHCYAEVSTPARTLRAGGLEVWGPPATTDRSRTSRANWMKPLAWNRTAERTGTRLKVFCASLADVFEDHPSLTAWRLELFALIEKTPLLDWQLLTKRPENLRKMLPASWLASPRPNVWLGTTVEDQASADERIPELLSTPAAVRFLSCEPLLGPVDLQSLAVGRCERCGASELLDGFEASTRCECAAEGAEPVDCERIDWVIVGGESGHNARAFDLVWARSIVEQCKSAEVAVFCKQLGAKPVDSSMVDILEPDLRVHYRRRHSCDDLVAESKQRPGYSVRPMVLALRDSHGGDPSEWPEDLRVRQFPNVDAGGER